EVVAPADDERRQIRLERLVGIVEADAAAVARAARQCAGLRVPVELGVIRVETEKREYFPRETPLDAVEARAPDIEGAEAAERIVWDGPAFDHILPLAVKIGAEDFDPIAEQRLVDARIQLPAPFRLEIRIAECGAAERRREKELVQRRRLEAFGVARPQLGSSVFEEIRGSKRRRPGAAEALVVIEADAGNERQ